MCYKLHPITSSFDDAQVICASEGATLMEPRSDADLHLLQSKWGQYGERYTHKMY